MDLDFWYCFGREIYHPTIDEIGYYRNYLSENQPTQSKFTKIKFTLLSFMFGLSGEFRHDKHLPAKSIIHAGDEYCLFFLAFNTCSSNTEREIYIKLPPIHFIHILPIPKERYT